MRLRWANSISTFLRSRRDVRPCQDLAISRALSRACSWIERGTFRAGVFGQHLGLNAQASQSALLDRSDARACGGQGLATGADVNILDRIKAEVLACEGAVLARRFVEHGHMGSIPCSSTSQLSISAEP